MQNKDSSVQATFNSVARRYDLINRLMTLGSHQTWCREVAARATSFPGLDYLDLATGTGVIAREIRKQHPAANITGADFSESMLDLARQINGGSGIEWQFADAHELPFADESFDAVTHGYLLRNVSDLDTVLAEQFRVLKPGGMVSALESSPPAGPLAPVIRMGMRMVIPTLGQFIGKDRASYEYLVDSTLGFLTPEALRERFTRAGFEDVSVKAKYLSTNMLWSARKPS
ncbi:ubiquinone/menaquinone biosynthesis methyltransferase [Paeniglutamicibacter gangotriensis]|uniref:Demethylmenaquinone methyltransferase n=2 Tax=Paeniglutamicibacter gangotriensis TaxID=254787 RepID=M7NIU5_9MICC|nr:ubiquinone/menaquinone biosynthesis methyltransferase [Paeniglutamicibacter gangotriensis]EMQ98478.1 ubiquinone/menaquinone biosynthesis methyltransferase [Paeniglutamicibacter gangotriensis Lz1y]